MMNTPLLIIPARYGSTRIPHKNTRPFAGGPSLLQRAVSFASTLAVPVVSANWDCRDDLAQLSLSTWIWHRRPAALGTDTASMVAVVLDVLDYHSADVVLVLQPTQPLRQLAHLRAALELLRLTPSVASVTLSTPAAKSYYRRANNTLMPILGDPVERDQETQPTYRCDGTVYGFHREWFCTNRTFRAPGITHALIVPPEETCQIDTPFDWMLAELRCYTLPPPGSLHVA